MASPDRAALLALYRSANGTGWSNNRNWDTEAELSQWHGVKVNEEGRVVELDLHWNKLEGSIPEELGDLDKLEKLILHSNTPLTGPIPGALGKLSELKELHLNGNDLTGPIPEELGRLLKLEKLWVYGNKLTGTIPRELGNMTALTDVQLRGNCLTGPIPRELGQLPALEVLNVNGNDLEGGVPTPLREHPNRRKGNFVFHISEDGVPMPAWSCASVLFPLVLGYLDFGTDVSAVVSYYEAGHMWWFALGLVFIVGPAWFAACVVVRGTTGDAICTRCWMFCHLGLLWEAFYSWVNSAYSPALVSLRLVEPLYESTPQLMLQMYVLLLEWGSEGAQWPFWRIFSVVTSGFSLAYATTGLVVEYPLSRVSPNAEGLSARCPGLTKLVFGTVPEDGSVEVYRSRWHPQNFVWAFLLYQCLEIGSRFISLALLALVVRAYFFLVLVWLWASRSVILRVSLGKGEERLRIRSQLRLVGMPFMDSVMDAQKSYDAGCTLTTVEFVACVTIANFLYKNEEGQAPDNVRLIWTYVAVAFMAGMLILGFLIVRPFKGVVSFGFGDEQQGQTQGSEHSSRSDVGNRDVEWGGSSRRSVRELVGPERRRGVRVHEDRFSSAPGQQGTLQPPPAF